MGHAEWADATQAAHPGSWWQFGSLPPADRVLTVTARPDAQAAAVLGTVHNILRRATPPPRVLGLLSGKPGRKLCQLRPRDLVTQISRATCRYHPDLFLVVDPAGERDMNAARIAEMVVLVGLEQQIPVLAACLPDQPGDHDPMRWLVPPDPAGRARRPQSRRHGSFAGTAASGGSASLGA